MKPERVKVMRKKYEVETYSHATAIMTVFANSKAEAAEIADRDMKESFEKHLKEAKPNPLVRDLGGWAGATKSGVKLIR